MARASLGQMRERVVIQQPTTGTDTTGGETTTPATLATVWAAVRPWPRAGGEFIKAGAHGSHVDYEVEIAYRGDVTPTMRLSWTPYKGSAKTLEIIEVHPLDGRRERELLECTEVR